MWKSLMLGVALVSGVLSAQAPVDVRGISPAWMDLGRPSGNDLFLDLDSAGVAVLPSEDGHVRVRYAGNADRDVSRVRLRFASANPSKLRVSNTPHNDFKIEIQVPKTISLLLRMTAGELTIQGVEGNKDIRLHAGEVLVHVGDPSAYGPVSASVWAGEVKPGPFGEPKEGLFRTFRHQGQGHYSLQVKLKAGEVTFQN